MHHVARPPLIPVCLHHPLLHAPRSTRSAAPTHAPSFAQSTLARQRCHELASLIAADAIFRILCCSCVSGRFCVSSWICVGDSYNQESSIVNNKKASSPQRTPFANSVVSSAVAIAARTAHHSCCTGTVLVPVCAFTWSRGASCTARLLSSST